MTNAPFSPAGPDDDAQDLRASLDGDGAAYGRLVARHQRAIAAYLWRFTRDRGECEELTHDVFVEAHRSLRSYAGRAPWSHWLRRIATRVGYRYWKARARRRAETSLSPETWRRLAQPENADATAAAETVHAVLAQLPPRDRLVLTLMYLEECSVAEIAQWCGWTQTMVKVQAHRARNRLRTLLEKQP